MRQILLTMLIVGAANVLHATDSSLPKTGCTHNSAMELLFESRTEITRRTGDICFFQRKPTIHPKAVLGPDSFVDGAGTMCYGTVLRDNGIFRMWYQAWPRDWENGSNSSLVGYAESDDGLVWRKPKLGLVDYKGKGTDNNLIDMFGHSFTVFIDPDVPGRTEENSIPLTGSSFDAAATWSDGDVLAPRPEGQSIKATLHMERASVYAYQILPAR